MKSNSKEYALFLFLQTASEKKAMMRKFVKLDLLYFLLNFLFLIYIK